MHTVEESTRLGRAIKALDFFSDSMVASLSNEKRQKLRALTSIEKHKVGTGKLGSAAEPPSRAEKGVSSILCHT